MKKCDHFKGLILTDYIDGELDKNSLEIVESHLLGCSDCRAYLKEVKNNTAFLYQQALHQQVPAGLWDAVREHIEEENHLTNPLEDFIDKLKGLMVFPRMVPIFASLLLMLLVGSVTLNSIQSQRAQAKDQGEYLVALLSSTGTGSPSDNNEWGTPIEHYFL